MKLTSVAPSLSLAVSSDEGARTLKMTSALDHTSAAEAATLAPAAAKASFGKLAPSPAPASTVTAKPRLISFCTTSGAVAMRFSPG